MRLNFARFVRDERGVYMIEMALVLAPLITLLLGGMELGRNAYATAVLQGTLTQAARKAGLEGASQATIKTFVDTQLAAWAPSSDITLSVTSFKKFTGVGNPEKITTDTPPLGTYNPGDCYVDLNNNNVYDASQGSNGIGTAEDALRVRIQMTLPRLTGVSEWIGYGNTYTIDRTTFVQAEPYAGLVDPPTRCS